MSFLEVSNLEKTFGGVKAVSSLSFSLQEGMICAVIGPNGAGKTTLFNMLTGIYQPDRGSILFSGKELAGLRPHKIARLGITRTFQNLQVFMNMSVIENVMVGCHLRTRSGILGAALRLPNVVKEEREVRKQALHFLRHCQIEHLAGSEAAALPYGALKRLEIARAVAARPRLLLMDEPAAGLNDTETVEMCGLIRRLALAGVTILLVEHNMGLVMEVSQRVLVLNYGRLLADDVPDRVQKDSKVIAAYLGQQSLKGEQDPC